MGAIVYISIGNSDDKLTQREWAGYFSAVALMLQHRGKVHGQWASEPASAWQNACWCIEFTDPDQMSDTKRDLAVVADYNRQDSIAWAEVRETEFLGPKS